MIYAVVISGIDNNRVIDIIKEVREMSSLGLKEAKKLVDKVRYNHDSVVIDTTQNIVRARNYCKALRLAGCTEVEIRDGDKYGRTRENIAPRRERYM